MDEWILDDLLECSVCLERLDTSSKVLPCQHTFCKKCLEEIHRTHNELRCPECRILVETKIDDLPPNVLLMRILEGIRNAAPDHQSSGSFHGGSGAGSGSVSHSELSASGGGVSLDKSPHLINTKTPPNDTKLRKLTNQPYARAIYDYPAKEQGDLSFKKGDVLYLKKKIDNNWYGGVDANGKAGVFPVSYVQVIIPLPVPLCKALYDFKMMNDEEESCLSFVKDEIITVIRRVDENWAEGKLKDRIGIFPIAFVELNSVARALMKLPALEAHPGLSRIAPPAPASKVEDFVTPSTDLQPRVSTAGFSLTTDATSDSSSNTVTSPSSSSSSSTPTPTTSSSLSPTSPSVVPVPNSSNKRHSFGSSLPHSALTKSKRHSAEIFISQDDEQPQSLPADIHAANQLPPAQLERSGSQRYNKNATDVPPIPGPQAKHSSLQLPALYVALYPYKPQKGDEIELKRGALYSVTERCQDGWFKGTLLRGQKTGVFPGNYVAPAKSLPALQAQLRGIGRTKPFSVSGSPKNGTPTLEPRNPMSYIKPQQMPTPPKAPETIQGGPAPSEQQSTAVVAPPNVSVQALSHKGIEKLIKDKRVGLMRRLASMKRSKSPPNTPYSMDNPVFEDSSVVFSQPVHVRSGSCPNQLLTSVADTNGASPHRLMSPSSSHRSKVKERPSLTLSIPTRYTAKPTIQHKKSSSMDTPGSLPDPSAILSHLSAAHFRSTLGDEIKSFTCSSTPSIPLNHSSSNDSFPSSASLIDPGPSDAAASKHKLKLESSTGVDFRLGGGLSGAAPSSLAPSKPPTSSSKLPASTREPSSSTHTSRNHSQSKFMARERFRCIVPYPPNSEYELELKIGDVIYVHKKRDDGWYKGTQERTGRTGLFPASFVQTF